MIQYDYEKRYEELSKNKDETFNNYLQPFILKNITSYIKNKNNNKINILDVGCGCGYLTGIIKDNFKETTIYGIDSSITAINVAKKYRSDIEFKKCNILNCKLKNNNIIILNMVLHNIEKIDIILKKIKELLLNDGIVLITIPHPSYYILDKVERKKIKLDYEFKYNDERMYFIPFQIKNQEKHNINLNYYHKKISTYINIFAKYFNISKMEEIDFKKGNPSIIRFILKNKN